MSGPRRRRRWFLLGRIGRPRFFQQRADLVICAVRWMPLSGRRPVLVLGIHCHAAHAKGHAFALVGELSVIEHGAN